LFLGGEAAKMHTSNQISNLHCFVDADWANDIDDRKSVGGFVIFFAGSVITWTSKKLKGTTALSSTEAEYLALTECVRELLWILPMIQEIGYPKSIPTIFEDNIPTINFCRNFQSKGRCKHLDVKLQFVKEALSSKRINLEHVSTQYNVADVLTKALAFNRHTFLTSKMMKKIK
jgi:hypothetical protein